MTHGDERAGRGAVGSSISLDGPTVAAPSASGAQAPTLVDPRPRPDAPAAIGRYRIEGRLGAGGMGVVYAGRDDLVDRRVALKLLHADAHPGRGDRLLGEAQAMAKLSHPNVAQIYEAGVHDGQVYIAMELIRGATLRAWLDAAPRRWPAIVDLFVAAGRGLAAAHQVGLIHRDFKPDNVLVGEDGRVVVVDFGVARLGRQLEMPRGAGSSDSGDRGPSALGISADGTIVGTPAYMSPEQWLGGHIDARSDIFSFCVALYEALHGLRPFAGNNAIDLARNVLSGTRTPTRRGAAPAWLDRLLARGLEVHPERRLPSMDALLDELLRDRARRRRRILASIGGVALAGGLGFGAALLGQEDPCAGAGDRVHDLWTPARRAALQATMGAGETYAAATRARVDERLDAYARAWGRGVRDACEATRVRGEASDELLDQRIACMSTRLRAFEAVVTTFEREGPAALDRSVEILAGVPALELCADDEYVRARVPPPRAAVAAAVEVIRDRLAALRAAADARDPTGSLPELEALGREAAALGYRPVLAEVEAARGSALLRLLAPDAEAVLRQAYLEAAGSGHDEVALETALSLATVTSVEVAGAWFTVAASLLERLQAEALLHARYHYVRLLRACSGGVCDDPIDPLLDAVERHRRVVGDDHPTLAALEANIANIHMLRREVADAERAYTAALRHNERLLGPMHPRLLTPLGNLARLALDRSDLATAAAHIDRARAIVDAHYSPSHPYAIGLGRLEADLATARGDLEGAVAILLRTIAATDAASPFRVPYETRLASLRRLLGAREAALAGLRAAPLAQNERDRLDMLIWSALLAAELGDPEARRLVDDVDARIHANPTDPSTSDPLTAPLEVLITIARARVAASGGALDGARAPLEARLTPDLAPELTGELHAALAQLLAATDLPRARREAAAALAALDRGNLAYGVFRREFARWLATLPERP